MSLRKVFFILRFLSLLFLTALISCNTERITSIEESDRVNVKANLETYPTIGTRTTQFKFNVVLSDSTVKIKRIQYDFNGDRIWDASKTNFEAVKVMLREMGNNYAISSITLLNDSVITCTTKVWVTEPKLILSEGGVFFEPSVYNNKIISVTHGPGHRAKLININTLQVNNFFASFTTGFDEMHESTPSFDGNKIYFTSSSPTSRYSYYDLILNNKTKVEIPLYFTSSYGVGQRTWSLDDKFIYGIVRNKTTSQLEDIQSFNLETKEVKSIYPKGNYICVVPYQKNKLAILEKTADNKSKLIVFDIINKKVEMQYDDLPFLTPFRMMENNDIIYLDGKLAFYSLSKKKFYYMRFDGIDLTRHMEGEADISIDGQTFVLATNTSKSTLYKIVLPVDLFY